MLGHIPTTDGLVGYLISIDSKLPVYEILTEAPALVELVIPNYDIVLHVLSFLWPMVMAARVRCMLKEVMGGNDHEDASKSTAVKVMNNYLG